MTPAIVWFRRDLRTHDHPALRAALAQHEEVVPFFCLDDRLLHGRHASGPRTQFMLECLRDLGRSLDGRLVVRHGRPERELARVAELAGAEDVYFSADVSPFARERAHRLAGLELRMHACPGLTIAGDVGDYSVFSPFHRRWLAAPRREVLAAPRRLSGPRLEGTGVPTLEELGLRQEVEEPMTGGETEGRRRLTNFLRGPIERYRNRADMLGDDRSSRLSPYLHFGCLSPREVEARLPQGESAEAFRRQLAWRDFYHQVLLHRPQNATQEHQERYRGSLAWERDDEGLRAWQEGRTGYPLVDAGMRQLRREGWMHNRARLVVASFLTKDLGIDWRMGERFFMRYLLDGDEANNNGNWQWIASVGVDPQPAYRRIYNPARQMERFDPRGAYVRRHVPELRSVPDEYLREPWKMPDEVQRAAGCVIGRDYPAPIVDHLEARREALERYRAAAA